MATADEIGGGWVGDDTLYRGLTMLHIFLSFSVVYYLSLLQKKAYTPSLILSATQGQSFRFNAKIFSRSTLAWGPETAVGDLAYRKYKEF
jgi:hypothetical protein